MTMLEMSWVSVFIGVVCMVLLFPKFIRSLRQMDRDLQNISKALEKYVKEDENVQH